MPRDRAFLRVYRETGFTEVRAERLAEDASVADRFAALKAAVPGPSADAVCWATVMCDGCGTRERVNWDNPVLPPGWASAEDGDYCGACAGRRGLN